MKSVTIAYVSEFSISAWSGGRFSVRRFPMSACRKQAVQTEQGREYGRFMAVMTLSFVNTRHAATAIAGVVALASTPLFAQVARGGPEPAAAPVQSTTLYDTTTNAPISQAKGQAPAAQQQAPAAQQQAPAAQQPAPSAQQQAERVIVPEISRSEPEQPAPRARAAVTGPAPAPTPAPATRSRTDEAANAVAPADAATDIDGIGVQELPVQPLPVDPDVSPTANAGQANGWVDLVYIAAAGAVALGLIALLLAMAARRSRRRRAPVRSARHMSSTNTIPMKPVMQRNPEQIAKRAPEVPAARPAANPNLSPEGNVTTPAPVAVRRRAADTIDGGAGWKGGQNRSVSFGDAPIPPTSAMAPAAEPKGKPAIAGTGNKRPVFAEPRKAAEPVGENGARDVGLIDLAGNSPAEAKPFMLRGAQPSPEPQVIDASAPSLIADDPVSLSHTPEGRDQLIEQLVAADPDDVIPFRSDKARRRRARLIVQAMMQRLEDDPNLEFARFYRDFGQQTEGGSPAMA